MRQKDFQFLTIPVRQCEAKPEHEDSQSTNNIGPLWRHFSKEAENIDITAEGISLHAEPSYVFRGKLDNPPLSTPVDFAIDECGIFYILDAGECNILIYDPETKYSEWLGCFGGCGSDPGKFCDPRAIALSSSDIYIAEYGNHRVQVFARINFQVRRIYYFTPEVKPLDLAVDSHGYLYILVSQPPSTPFYTGLDFQPELDNESISDEFQQEFIKNSVPLSDSVSVMIQEKGNKWLIFDRGNTKTYIIRKEGEKLSICAPPYAIQQFDESGKWQGSFLEGLEKPTHLTVRDDFIYVPEGDYGRILRFNIRTKKFVLWLSRRTEEVTISKIKSSSLAVDKAQNVYYIFPAKSKFVLGLSRRTGEEEHTFLYKLDTSKGITEKLLQLPGMYDQLHIDKKGNLYALDGKTGEITFLESVQVFSRNGSYVSKAFDSGMPGLQWHKIVVEAEIPEKTQITVSCYTSDNEDPIPSDAWSQPSMVNPKDALILSSNGRYLWLKFTLFGDGLCTPRIRSVRAYFPRLSYLRYLPGIYQEDASSRDFLERFLSLFETFFFNLEEEIFNVTRYLDVIATPSGEDSPENDFLSWLGSWLAAAFDENWTPAKKRELLKAAPELYKKRGTRAGLQEFIRIYTGKEPIIVESFQIRHIVELWESSSKFDKTFSKSFKDENIKQTWKALFVGDNYSFCVLLRPGQVETASQLNTVRRIVQLEKPAHTGAGVVELQPWIYPDMHTYLGINSILSEPVFRLGETSVISRDTVLSDSEKGGQLVRHARLGTDTILT